MPSEWPPPPPPPKAFEEVTRGLPCDSWLRPAATGSLRCCNVTWAEAVLFGFFEGLGLVQQEGSGSFCGGRGFGFQAAGLLGTQGFPVKGLGVSV